jgi:hypothetical protein
VVTEDGQIWFWGGYYYDGNKGSSQMKQQIEGFNLLNEEVGLPPGAPIVSYGMGFAHDTVVIEEEPSRIVIDY